MRVIKLLMCCPRNLRLRAFGLLVFSVTAVSSCTIENSESTGQSVQRYGLPFGVPENLKNTAWKASIEGDACGYYIIFGEKSRIDAVQCGEKLSYSEYLSGHRSVELQEKTTEPLATEVFGPGAMQLSSEGFVRSSCETGEAAKKRTDELYGHAFFAALSSGTDSLRHMKVWTRKESNSIVYSEVTKDSVTEIVSKASCL